MPNAAANPLSIIFRREIERFVEATGDAGTMLYNNRRQSKRRHRECPLLVARLSEESSIDVAGTLMDVSENGIGFLCDAGFSVGTLISVKLFWSDVFSPRIPVIVRHTEIHPEGFMVGAEFATSDLNACKILEEAPTSWCR